MDLNDLDICEFGEKVKALHGGDVYEAALRAALATAIRNAVAVIPDANDLFPNAPARAQVAAHAVTNEAVVAALRAEFLKLLRPH